MSVVADTHALIWYLDAPQELSSAALAALDAAANTSGEHVFISVITLIEIQYLTEKGRLKPDVLVRIEQELDELDPIVVTVALDRMIAKTMASIARDLVPDMPDRIIAATARALGLPLVTRDLGIRRAGLTTIW